MQKVYGRVFYRTSFRRANSVYARYVFVDRGAKKQFDGEYEYYYCLVDGKKAGFIGLEYEKDALFLSKLYLAKEYRGRGLASKMFAFIEKQAIDNGYRKIYLTCNKYNRHSLDVYAKKGFEIVESVVTDIGSGFVMDDYVLEKKI